MSGKQRILARLQAGQDVSPIDYQLPGVVDGGKPILRVAARILELRQDGHQIDVIATRNECAVYRLIAAGERLDELPRVYCRQCGQEGSTSPADCQSCAHIAWAGQQAEIVFSNDHREVA